ncbi:hypothetical protein PRBEI_2000494200 [Prionailurus iriomotensis]
MGRIVCCEYLWTRDLLKPEGTLSRVFVVTARPAAERDRIRGARKPGALPASSQ